MIKLLFTIILFISANSFAVDEYHENLYNDVVAYYREQALLPDPEDVEIKAEIEDEAEDEIEKAEIEDERSRRLAALLRKERAEKEIARLKKLKERKAREEKEDGERRIREAKIQQLLKALGYNEIADEMHVTEKVSPPL